MNQSETEKIIITILATIVSLALLAGMTSCSSLRRNYDRESLISGKNHKATKRDLKRSMQYSTWEYAIPKNDIMIPMSQSNMIFETTNK